MRSSKLEIKFFRKNKNRLIKLQQRKELTPEEQAEKDDLTFYIRTLLNSLEVLNEQQKEFIKNKIQGLTIEEISAISFISKTSVFNVLSKSYKILDSVLNYKPYYYH